jgi:putative ABC transport system permease protein
LVTGGLAAGAVTGWAVSAMLVAVLTGVFDPPPASITVPWPYLAGVALLTIAAAVAGTAAVTRHARRATPAVLREL